MKRKADVVIIGGGINGCALAYLLAKKGINVVVVEQEYLSSGATGACGAGIRQQWSTKENTELAIKSVKIFEKLSKELGENIEFRQGGYLIAIHDDKDMEQATKNVAMQRSLGLTVDIVPPEKIPDIVPILDAQGMRAIGATFCPTDGHANPFKTTFAYARAAQRHGATIYTHTKATGIILKNRKVSGVQTEKGIITTPTVVNAAGVQSTDVAKMADISLPNVPLRKEIMVTERFEPLFEAMVISFKDGIYFSQQPEGHIVGGIPIPDQQSGYKTLPTVSFVRHMASTLTRYAPRLKHINMLRHWTGFYDVTPDSRPILGEDHTIRGFIHCYGFSGHGFMLSPMVTTLLAEYIAEGKASLMLTTLHLDRFKGKKIEQETSVVG